jgi:hypothetical protein
MTGWNKAQHGSCGFAMLSSSTDSATELATICSIVEIFMCRYSRMMKSLNSALVPASVFLSKCSRCEFENIVGIYFLFFEAGREFHIYEESHAPGRGNVICRTTASVASASLLVSNVCMHIRVFCMILISLLSDRNHTEDHLNVPANVPG